MPNIVTGGKEYKSIQRATDALEKMLIRAGTTLDQERWLISIMDHDAYYTFVPVLVGMKYIPYAGLGVMVVS